jgi:uncharacterized protein (DUF1697 family)
MALVVFIRGINVGGHRKFRPSMLAKELSRYDVVNVGAAGTFVVRRPGSEASFRAEFIRKLPFEANIIFCRGHEILQLEKDNPFGTQPPHSDIVRFVSILSKVNRGRVRCPITIPPGGEWHVQVIASKSRFIFGMYRRRMKTIGYLGQVDKLFGAPATTRNWNTILALARILRVGTRKDAD